MLIERLAGNVALLVWVLLMEFGMRVEAVPVGIASLVLARRSRRA